jgi:hypothetical protein
MKRKDVNEIAFNIVQQAIGALPVQRTRPKSEEAVALGRKGGLKGGKARAKSLSDKEKRRIARKAAAARWARKP